MGRRRTLGSYDRHDCLPVCPEETMALPGDGGGRGGMAAGTWPSSCLCSDRVSPLWHRSLKRKLDERERGATRCISCVDSLGNEDVARVDIENEAAALREALDSHKQTVQKLLAELEEERSAAGSAATEAMSMIIRLQSLKAEAQMEARQFKRLAEEKMTHDQQEIASLEELLFKRDQAVQTLTCEVQTYRHRLLSYGIGIDGDGDGNGEAPSLEPQTPDTATPSSAVSQFDHFPCDYPPLRCSADAAADLDRYPSAETPREHINTLHRRVFQSERLRSNHSFMDKGVVVRQSPRRRSSHLRSFSFGSFASELDFPSAECSSDCSARDDMSDRVCTVDAVHGAREDYVSTPRELQGRRTVVDGAEGAEIRTLYMRLQALEADKESMRQTLISMGTDKAQMALLKEIAQQMCKEAATERKVFKKSPSSKKISIMSKIKSVVHFVFWRRRSRVKFTFGLSSSNAGLLLLLDKSPRMRHRRFLKATGVTSNLRFMI